MDLYRKCRIKFIFGKHKADYYMRRIYKLLRNPNTIVILRSCGSKYAGACENNLIFIDPAKDIFPTLIHEALHLLYTELGEGMITKMEHSICYHLTERQVTYLLSMLALAVNRSQRYKKQLHSYDYISE